MPDNNESAHRQEAVPGQSEIDVNQIRDLIIQLHGLAKADEAYTVYYDETNNIRRLLLTDGGINNPDPKCFVLGGIAHAGRARELRLPELRASLRLQKTVTEMKLDHLGKGNFLQVIAAPKIETFLRWLIAEGLFIHCVVLDPLYWSIVDIIDSILAIDENTYLRAVGHNLKSDFYTVLMDDRAHLIEMLSRYTYPNVGQAHKSAFIQELLELLEAKEGLLPGFNYQMLKGALQIAANQDSMPYIEDEKPNVLIDELSGFFINRICILKNAQHVFDQEPWIEGFLAKLTFLDHGSVLRNYRFTNSKSEPGIQVSDVVAGLLGKYFTFLNTIDWPDLRDAKLSLSDRQRAVVTCLNALIDQAVDENPVFIHSVLSIEDHRKSEYFLEP